LEVFLGKQLSDVFDKKKELEISPSSIWRKRIFAGLFAAISGRARPKFAAVASEFLF
jgi:hypothetical protein